MIVICLLQRGWKAYIPSFLRAGDNYLVKGDSLGLLLDRSNPFFILAHIMQIGEELIR